VEKTAEKREMLLYGERGWMIALRGWAGQKSVPSLRKNRTAHLFSKVRTIRFHHLKHP
jgi:hypothetical protein